VFRARGDALPSWQGVGRTSGPRVYAFFRGCGGLSRGADVPTSRDARKLRRLGWNTARLLRASELAFLLWEFHHAWLD